MIEQLDGDAVLFGKVREELILDDIAEDKKQVGLVYVKKEESTNKDKLPSENKVIESNQPIFISYGRQDALEFTRKLTYDLEHRANRQVWLDMKSIEKGRWFEVKVEEGIRSASVILAVISPHSLREESICRDEVVFALNEGKPVVPIQTSRDVKLPLLLARRNWIDFSDDYEEGFRSLLCFLNGDQQSLKQPGLQSVTGVAPFDFGPEIARYTTGFTGREWLKEEVEYWLSDSKNRVLIIIGEPGIGKSAIAAWISQKFRNQVVGIHFCTQRNTRTLNVFEFVANIVGQLHSQLPEYARIVETKRPESRRSTASDAFRELVIEPSRLMTNPGRTCFFIIDSLDEAILQEGENIVDILSEHAGDLPAWLKFFATSRPEEDVIRRIRILHTYELNANRQENLYDVKTYIEKKLQNLDNKLNPGNTSSSVINTIEKISQGNFLYATMVMDALENNTLTVDEIGELMPGLSCYFDKAFKRIFPDLKEYSDNYSNILKVLAVSLGPIPGDLLSKITGITIEQLNLRLSKIKSFLRIYGHGKSQSYTLFHKSLADWLSDYNASGRYWCDPNIGYNLLSDSLFTQWGEHEYALQFLPEYLINSQRWTDLKNLLTNLFYIEKKVIAGYLYELHEDFKNTVENITDQEDKAIIADFEEAFRWEMHILKMYPRITFQSLYNHLKWKDEKIQSIIEPSHKKYLESGNIMLNQYRVPVLENTNIIMTLMGHNDYVNACSWSPDVKKIVTAGSDSVLKIWDVKNGKEIATLEGHEGAIYACSWSPDGQIIASAGDDRFIRFWDAEKGTEVKSVLAHDKLITCLAWASTGNRIVTGSYDRTLKVWDYQKDAPEYILTGHTDEINTCNWSHDGRYIISAGKDKTIRIWSNDSGTEIKCIQGHKRNIMSCCFSPDGKKIASASYDKTLIIWDFETGDRLNAVKVSDKITNNCAWSPDGSKILAAGWKIKIYNAGTLKEIAVLKGHTRSVNFCQWSFDGKKIASVGNLEAMLWDVEKTRLAESLLTNSFLIYTCPWSYDGGKIATGSLDKRITIYESKTGKEIKSIEGHNWRVNFCSWSPMGDRIVSGGMDNKIIIWDTESGQKLMTFEGHEYNVSVCKYSPDGNRIVSGGYDNVLKIWNANDGALIKRFIGHDESIRICDWSPDSRLLISAGEDGIINQWDVNKDISFIPSLNHSSTITGLCWSPDARKIVSVSRDGRLRIFDSRKMTEILSFSTETFFTSFCDWSINGKLIVTSAADGSIKIWDSKNGSLSGIYCGLGSIYTCNFSHDGNSISFGDKVGNLYLTQIEGFERNIPIVTGVRLWNNASEYKFGIYDDFYSVLCPICGKFIKFPEKMSDVIMCIHKGCQLSSEDSPILKLPDEAWDEPGLLSECPQCSGKLKFNPFIVDNRGTWDK
jgi:WD40 repeat protein